MLGCVVIGPGQRGAGSASLRGYQCSRGCVIHCPDTLCAQHSNPGPSVLLSSQSKFKSLTRRHTFSTVPSYSAPNTALPASTKGSRRFALFILDAFFIQRPVEMPDQILDLVQAVYKHHTEMKK